MIYPSTHRSLEDDYEFGSVIIYDSGLFVVETDREEFEREISQEELFNILQYILKRFLGEKTSNEKSCSSSSNISSCIP